MEPENNNITISVIIVNFNTYQLTYQCIETIIKYSTEISYEIIVVDNNSSENCDELQISFPNIILVKNIENYGFGKANNIGSTYASGKYLCFINSDIIFLENTLKIIYERAQCIDKLGILGPRLLWNDRSLQWSCREFPNLWNNFCPALYLTKLFKKSKTFRLEHMTYFPHDIEIEVDVLVGAFLLIPTDIFTQAGGFDEQFFMYSEEIDLCKRIKSKGYKIIFSPVSSVVHIAGATANSNFNEKSLQSNISRLKYWKKHSSIPILSIVKVIWTMNLLLKLIFNLLSPNNKLPVRIIIKQIKIILTY